jgi:hypothetical protein
MKEKKGGKRRYSDAGEEVGRVHDGGRGGRGVDLRAVVDEHDDIRGELQKRELKIII